MNSADSLKSFVGDEQNIFEHMYTAKLKKLKVVYRALRFAHADDFMVLTVDYELVFYGVAFLLSRV